MCRNRPVQQEQSHCGRQSPVCRDSRVSRDRRPVRGNRPVRKAQPRPQEQPSVQEVVGTVLRTEHARLLLPIWLAPRAQCVPPQSAANAVTLVVPGVPEANNAYELTPSGVQELRRKRVAGGVSVTLDEFGLTAQVLLAHDPLIVGAVNGRAAGDRASRGRAAASPGRA